MRVYFWTSAGRAYIDAVRIAKEYRTCIRFLLEDGTTMSIKRSAIITMEVLK